MIGASEPNAVWTVSFCLIRLGIWNLSWWVVSLIAAIRQHHPYWWHVFFGCPESNNTYTGRSNLCGFKTVARTKEYRSNQVEEKFWYSYEWISVFSVVKNICLWANGKSMPVTLSPTWKKFLSSISNSLRCGFFFISFWIIAFENLELKSLSIMLKCQCSTKATPQCLWPIFRVWPKRQNVFYVLYKSLASIPSVLVQTMHFFRLFVIKDCQTIQYQKAVRKHALSLCRGQCYWE